jgi:hypothetical protein
MQTILKQISVFIITFVFFFSFIQSALATDFNKSLEKTSDKAGYIGADSSGFTNKKGTDLVIGETISQMINIILSIIGTLFFLFLLYAGFTWMNSKGNETEIKKALSIIQQTLIGLTIVFLAYVITRFLI